MQMWGAARGEIHVTIFSYGSTRIGSAQIAARAPKRGCDTAGEVAQGNWRSCPSWFLYQFRHVAPTTTSRPQGVGWCAVYVKYHRACELKLPRKNRACGKEKPQAVYTLGAREVCCLNLGSLGRAAECRGWGAARSALTKDSSALGSSNAASCRNVNRCGHVSTQTE